MPYTEGEEQRTKFTFQPQSEDLAFNCHRWETIMNNTKNFRKDVMT